MCVFFWACLHRKLACHCFLHHLPWPPAHFHPCCQYPHHYHILLNILHYLLSAVTVYPHQIFQTNCSPCGSLPGPHELKLNINSFQNPLVCELLKFWEGIDMSMNKNMNKTVCCALVYVACGISAVRKVCGFLSHNAKLGCTCCSRNVAVERDQQITLVLM